MLAFSQSQANWSIAWFAIYCLWFVFVFLVARDVLRDHEVGGFMKAVWILAVIVVPIIGLAAYVLVRGDHMGRRAQEAHDNDEPQPLSISRIPYIGGDQYTSCSVTVGVDPQQRDVMNDSEMLVLKGDLMRR